MSESNSSPSPDMQPLTSKLTWAHISTDQAVSSLLTGCQAPAVFTTTLTSVPFVHPESKDPNVTH